MRQIPPRETRAAAHARPGRAAGLLRSGRQARRRGGRRRCGWSGRRSLLAAAGAHVEVFAPDPCAELDALCASAAGRQHSVVRRRWRADDLGGRGAGCWRVRPARTRSRFAAAARAHGVPVNIVDTPALSDLQLRQHRQSLAGGDRHQHRWRRAGPGAGDPRQDRGAAASRARLPGRRRRSGCAPSSRRGCRWGRPAAMLWRRFADRALAARARADRAGLARARRFRAARKCGSVALVGAGPGDPELLTLKALRALQSADVILYDRLVSPEILELARREARRMLVGKAGSGASCRQDDINPLMVRLARGRQARGASQGRRSHGVRPRRRGARRLPRRRHRRRGRARHHGGARRRRRAADPA